MLSSNSIAKIRSQNGCPSIHTICFPPLAPSKVWRQSFWMRGWGARTPKRTTLWSNSRAIRKFQTASKFSRAAKSARKLADVYYDRAGNKRYKGNRNLKSSQCKAKISCFFFVRLVFKQQIESQRHVGQFLWTCSTLESCWVIRGSTLLAMAFASPMP